MALIRIALLCCAVISQLGDASETMSLVQKQAVVLSDDSDEDVDTAPQMLSSDTSSNDDLTWQRITCPVIGSLFKNGDLVPNAAGVVTKAQTRAAMLRAGCVVERTSSRFVDSPDQGDPNLSYGPTRQYAGRLDEMKSRMATAGGSGSGGSKSYRILFQVCHRRGLHGHGSGSIRVRLCFTPFRFRWCVAVGSQPHSKTQIMPNARFPARSKLGSLD